LILKTNDDPTKAIPTLLTDQEPLPPAPTLKTLNTWKTVVGRHRRLQETQGERSRSGHQVLHSEDNEAISTRLPHQEDLRPASTLENPNLVEARNGYLQEGSGDGIRPKEPDDPRRRERRPKITSHISPTAGSRWLLLPPCLEPLPSTTTISTKPDPGMTMTSCMADTEATGDRSCRELASGRPALRTRFAHEVDTQSSTLVSIEADFPLTDPIATKAREVAMPSGLATPPSSERRTA